MKLMKAMTMAMAILVPASWLSTAQAIELRNHDSEKHRVIITSTEMEKDIEVRPNTLSLVVCVGVCEFDVVGIGTVRARGSDHVIIADGEVSVRRVEREGDPAAESGRGGGEL